MPILWLAVSTELEDFGQFPYVIVEVYFKYFEGLSRYTNTFRYMYVSKRACTPVFGSSELFCMYRSVGTIPT